MLRSLPLFTLLACAPQPDEAPVDGPTGDAFERCIGEGHTIDGDGERSRWFTEYRDADLRETERVEWRDADRIEPGTRMTWTWQGDLVVEEWSKVYGNHPSIPDEQRVEFTHDTDGKLLEREQWLLLGGEVVQHVREVLAYDGAGLLVEVVRATTISGESFQMRDVTTWVDGRKARVESFEGGADEPAYYSVWTYDAPAPALDYRSEVFASGQPSPRHWSEVVHDAAGRPIATTEWNTWLGTLYEEHAWDDQSRPTGSISWSDTQGTTLTSWTYTPRGLLKSRLVEWDADNDGVIDALSEVRTDWTCQ